MSNQKNDRKPDGAPPKHSKAPDGKSQLPDFLPDFPPPGGGGGGDSPE